MAFKFKGEDTAEISFPLGGIGAGSVGLTGNGRLIDWEIFHRPNRRSTNGYTSFAVKAENSGKVLDARFCQGDCPTDFMGGGSQSWSAYDYGYGVPRVTLAGMPHFENTVFEGKYPIAKMTLKDKHFPGTVLLEAYNPFIPANSEDSSLPCAIFKWTLKNTSDKDIDYTVAFSCCNLLGNKTKNEFVKKGKLNILSFTGKEYNEHQGRYGNMAIATDCTDCTCQKSWFRGSWFDDLTTFWGNFTSPGKLVEREYEGLREYGGDMGTICATIHVPAGKTGKVSFVLAWYFPNVHKNWSGSPLTDEQKKNVEEKKWDEPMWKAYYVKKFGSSIDVAKYVYKNARRLYKDTALFRDTLFSSSVPECVVDAIQGTIAVLKSSTCLRLENGEFWAFEGSSKEGGSCEGTCAHVWNYAYAMPFLFPDLERSIREQDYTYNTTPTGEMRFRQMLPLGSFQSSFRACVDGQMGGVMKFYREWKICGDDEWLKKYWPEVKKSIEYAWSPDNYDKWDPEQKGVITGRQHHTLDVELFGASSWLNGFYLGALKAGAEMAEHLGEKETAAKYRAILKKGQEWTEKNLFNGKHYIQKVDVSDKSLLDGFEGAESYWNSEVNQIKYQIGEGCIIDQVLAQWHANLIGLGDVLDPKHCETALKNMYRISFKSMREFFNPCRVYATDDEKGVIICNWDEGSEMPKIPIPYSQEFMTGFEYAAGDAMLMYGMEKEAVEVAAAIRERYNGKRRNPWSEIECGASYARPMASYSYLLTFSGFEYDMSVNKLGFNPLHPDDGYKTFWALDGAWGSFEIKGGKLLFNVLYGNLTIKTFAVPAGFRAKTAECVGVELDVTQRGRNVSFTSPITVGRGDTLIIG